MKNYLYYQLLPKNNSGLIYTDDCLMLIAALVNIFSLDILLIFSSVTLYHSSSPSSFILIKYPPIPGLLFSNPINNNLSNPAARVSGVCFSISLGI
jgi:hypothetical protein